MFKNSQQSGLALIPVLIVVTALFLAAVLMSFLTGHSIENVAGEKQMTQAFYAAETGLEMTKAAILSSPVWYRHLPDMGVDVHEVLYPRVEVAPGSSCRVTVHKAAQAIGSGCTIKSEGRHTGAGDAEAARKTLQATIGVFEARDYLRGLTVLPAQDQTPVLSGPMTIGGDLIVDGALQVQSEMVLQGDVYAAAEITGSYPGAATTQYPYIPPRLELDEAYYRQQAASYGQLWETDTAFLGPFELADAETAVPVYRGFYFIDGDLDLAGYYQGQALIFCRGTIRLQGDLLPAEAGAARGGTLTLVTPGDVDLGRHRIYAHVIAGGMLRAQSGSTLWGAACAGGVAVAGESSAGGLLLGNEVGLTVPEGVLPSPVLKTIDWQELYSVF